MKLHELSPAAGSATPAWRKGRGPGSGNGKTKTLVPAAVFVRDLKADKTRFTENFRREASTITLQRTLLL